MTGHDSWTNHLGSASTAGAVAYGASRLLYGNQNIKMPNGMLIPLPLFLAGAGFAGSLLSNVTHDYLLPHIHIGDRLRQPVAVSLNVATNAVTQGVALTLLDGGGLFSQIDKGKLLLEAGATVMVSHFLWDNYIAPLVFGIDQASM